MDIGLKIRAARKAKGLSQEDLGKLLGVQKSAVAKYENGRIKNIKRSTLKQIALILDMRPAELIFEEEIKEKPKELAERHIEILMNEEFINLFEDYRSLDTSKRKIVSDLIHSLAET